VESSGRWRHGSKRRHRTAKAARDRSLKFPTHAGALSWLAPVRGRWLLMREIICRFNSIMLPSIFALGVAELGPLTGNGSGLMNMAIVGGAIIPVTHGAMADRIGIQYAFFLPVICYLYILFYALRGSMPNSERHSN
jgi:fucose permease